MCPFSAFPQQHYKGKRIAPARKIANLDFLTG
jgi:hypothetical protein